MSIPYQDEDRALITVVPHTTSPRNSRFEISVKTSFLHSGAFDAQSLISIPKAKLVRKLGSLSQVQITSVEDHVRRWLGL